MRGHEHMLWTHTSITIRVNEEKYMPGQFSVVLPFVIHIVTDNFEDAYPRRWGRTLQFPNHPRFIGFVFGTTQDYEKRKLTFLRHFKERGAFLLPMYDDTLRMCRFQRTVTRRPERLPWWARWCRWWRPRPSSWWTGPSCSSCEAQPREPSCWLDVSANQQSGSRRARTTRLSSARASATGPHWPLARKHTNQSARLLPYIAPTSVRDHADERRAFSQRSWRDNFDLRITRHWMVGRASGEA